MLKFNKGALGILFKFTEILRTHFYFTCNFTCTHVLPTSHMSMHLFSQPPRLHMSTSTSMLKKRLKRAISHAISRVPTCHMSTHLLSQPSRLHMSTRVHFTHDYFQTRFKQETFQNTPHLPHSTPTTDELLIPSLF
jgi:hypothetical protein